MAAWRKGKVRWADKNPENALNIHHWERLLAGRMAFVLVVRHPLDIIASMAEIRMDRVIPVDVAGRASHIVSHVTAGLDFVDRHPERSTIVRYEHLVADPQGTLGELMLFLGEKYDEAMISGAVSDLHGQGLEDPKAGRHSRISVDNLGRWRRDLAEDDVRVAMPIVAGLCARFGYNVESRSSVTSLTRPAGR
jgi:hypothetical protein